MRILVIGAGGVGSAAVGIADRRAFFEHMVVADYDPARVDAALAKVSGDSRFSGERVDAIVRADRTIPVDSKFPLDNFLRVVEAESDDQRALAERQFGRDVKQHIDAIASKYIRPDEGTYDFAFMYIPVEAVYYELACGKTGALLSYAHERRVFPVSPTTFTAYLQVIALGLRGMQIEQHAHEVMAYVAELQRDFDRFAAWVSHPHRTEEVRLQLRAGGLYRVRCQRR